MLRTDPGPRSPRRSAEDMMRRGYALGDPELVARGRDLLRYAEEQEARTVEHDRVEYGSPIERKCTYVGAVFGFFSMTLWLAAPWFGLLNVLGWFSVLGLTCAAAYGMSMAVKRARR